LFQPYSYLYPMKSNHSLPSFLHAWTPKLRWALLIALISDALGFVVVLLPPLQWLLDAVTAIALLMVLGFRWPLLIALAIEVIPAIELFPAWTLVVLALMASEKKIANKN
jgi:amino acid transporter